MGGRIHPRDIVVIGGGVGGYAAALKAARRGARVTLIERDRIGGVCLNRGCIPTKVLLHATDLLHEARKAALFGVMIPDVRLDFRQVQARKEAIVAKLTGGVAALLRAGKIRVISGSAAFLDASTVLIAETGEKLTAEKFVIATGSAPARLPITGAEAAGIITSDDLLALEVIPESLVIVGGGYVGVELGQFFARAGAKVTLVERAEHLVPTEDVDIAASLETALRSDGIEVLTGATVKQITLAGGMRRAIVATPSGDRSITAKAIAQAVGRVPNISGLGLEMAGVATRNGAIVVDDGMRTTIPHIFAVGDAIGGIMLAHVAIAEAECAVRSAFDQAGSVGYRAVPRCIYTSPEVACVGFTERQAADAGHVVRVSRLPLHAVGKALLVDGQSGMVKIVADDATGELLGMHIIGPHATEMISEAVLAIGLECTAEEIAATIHPHPTVAEGIGEAAMMLSGGALHLA